MTFKSLKELFKYCPDAIDDLSRKDTRRLKKFISADDFKSASYLIISSKQQRESENREDKINELLGE